MGAARHRDDCLPVSPHGVDRDFERPCGGPEGLALEHAGAGDAAQVAPLAVAGRPAGGAEGCEREGRLADALDQAADASPDRAGLEAHERGELDERAALVIDGQEQGPFGGREEFGHRDDALVRDAPDAGRQNMSRTLGLDNLGIRGKIGF